MEKTSVQVELSSYLGKLLRDHFGKGPSSVYVSINKPFITMHIRDFLAPMERVLIDQGKWLKVEELRDHLMEELLPEIKATLQTMLDIEIAEMYYDWTLENRSGMILAVLKGADHELKDYPEKDLIQSETAVISEMAEKVPERIDSCFLNNRTLLIRRDGILVRIEKELIKNGFEEALRLSKKGLEKRLLKHSEINTILDGKATDLFVDWDFAQDKSYIIFVL